MSTDHLHFHTMPQKRNGRRPKMLWLEMDALEACRMVEVFLMRDRRPSSFVSHFESGLAGLTSRFG